MMKSTIVMLSVVLLGAMTVRGNAADVVEIHLNGHFYSAPATVRVTVAVEPDKANRVLRIAADGDALYRATEVTLEGASEKRLHTVEFKNLPAGEYELRAEVLSTHDVRAMATQELTVTGLATREY